MSCTAYACLACGAIVLSAMPPVACRQCGHGPGPLGACWMRCCRAWEEDDNAVDWGSFADGGYLHWGRAECRQ